MPIREPTLNEIIKLHLIGVSALDAETARKLLPQLDKVELQLRQEMDRFSTDQFSYVQRQQTIKSINKSIIQMEKLILDEMKDRGQDYFDFGIKQAEEEVSYFNADSGLVTPSISKDKLSLKQNSFLINNMEASINTYGAGVRTMVSNALTQAILAGKTGYEVTLKLSQFVKIKKYRIMRIARTEMHKIYNNSKLLSYGEFKEQHFPDMMKRLFHPMDHRTADDSKQLKQLDPAVPLGKPFTFVYKRRLKNGQIRTEKRIFQSPPDRPNDRATVLPYRKRWEK